jgi:carbon-monoxide dehydrogenase medium subunit
MYRLARPRILVDLNGLSLGEISEFDGGLRVGALVRHHQLIESALVAERCPVLAEAARLVGNVRVRALGTLGGSLAHADPAAELAMVVTALDARLTARSVRGERVLGPRDFFTGHLSTALEPDEVLVDVRVPGLGGAGYAVEEFSRRAGDFAVAAVAAVVAIDSHGLVDDARVALGGVGATAVRARVAEDLLRGHAPTADRIGQAAAAARAAVEPDSDAFVSAAYRRHLAGVLARRAIGRAVARAMGSAAEGPGQARGDRGLTAMRLGATARGPARLGGGMRSREPSPGAERARQDLTRSAAGGLASAAGRSAGSGGAGWALRPVRLTINGRGREVGVLPNQTLLEVLRDALGIFDAKEGCGEGVCGACTVLLDGRPVSSCLVLAPAVGDREIVTVRGIEREGGLHPLQEAFVRHGAVQCGFCTPGMLLTTLAFLEGHPDPDREAIRAALEGNLCRCTGYTKIVDAVEAYVRAGRRE